LVDLPVRHTLLCVSEVQVPSMAVKAAEPRRRLGLGNDREVRVARIEVVLAVTPPSPPRSVRSPETSDRWGGRTLPAGWYSTPW
jgi:hypothetical protein